MGNTSCSACERTTAQVQADDGRERNNNLIDSIQTTNEIEIGMNQENYKPLIIHA